jgi:hypothetical protein
MHRWRSPAVTRSPLRASIHYPSDTTRTSDRTISRLRSERHAADGRCRLAVGRSGAVDLGQTPWGDWPPTQRPSHPWRCDGGALPRSSLSGQLFRRAPAVTAVRTLAPRSVASAPPDEHDQTPTMVAAAEQPAVLLGGSRRSLLHGYRRDRIGCVEDKRRGPRRPDAPQRARIGLAMSGEGAEALHHCLGQRETPRLVSI